MNAEVGDTVRIMAKDVTHLVNGPVTAGLTGTASLRNWDTPYAIVVGPSALVQLGLTDDWYVDVTCPSVGRYKIEVILANAGAARTLHGELIARESVL